LVLKPRYDGSEDDYDMEVMHDDDDESWVSCCDDVSTFDGSIRFLSTVKYGILKGLFSVIQSKI